MDLETGALRLDTKVVAEIAGRPHEVNVAGFAVFNDRQGTQVLVEWMDGNLNRQAEWTPINKVTNAGR